MRGGGGSPDRTRLAGRLLDRGGWTHVALPAIAECEQELPIGAGHVYRRRIGDILDPVREPREVLNQTRLHLGSAAFEAQYQQQPLPEDGGLVTWSWFQSYDAPPVQQPNDMIVVSWDTAMKDREVNDYSAAIVALVRPNRQMFILDVIRQRLDFPSLRKRIVDEAKSRNATTLIESAGSGISLLQDLRGQVNLIGRQPFGDKVVRFQTVTPMIEGQQVHLPARAPWLDAFRRELLSFPGGGHDDQVDALSQLLNWIRERTTYTASQSRYGYNI